MEETNLTVASYAAARRLLRKRKLSIWSLRPGWLKVSDFFPGIRLGCCAAVTPKEELRILSLWKGK